MQTCGNYILMKDSSPLMPGPALCNTEIYQESEQTWQHTKSAFFFDSIKKTSRDKIGMIASSLYYNRAFNIARVPMVTNLAATGHRGIWAFNAVVHVNTYTAHHSCARVESIRAQNEQCRTRQKTSITIIGKELQLRTIWLVNAVLKPGSF